MSLYGAAHYYLRSGTCCNVKVHSIWAEAHTANTICFNKKVLLEFPQVSRGPCSSKVFLDTVNFFIVCKYTEPLHTFFLFWWIDPIYNSFFTIISTKYCYKTTGLRELYNVSGNREISLSLGAATVLESKKLWLFL